MYATCSALNCNLRGIGLASAGNALSNPRLPAYLPSPIIASISSRYVFVVATTHRPSPETSIPRMGSPNAGSAVFAFLPMESNNLMSPLSPATASFPDPVVVTAENFVLVVYCFISFWTILFPDSRGSILYNAFPEIPTTVCSPVVCAYLSFGAILLTGTYSSTFHSSTTLPLSMSKAKSEFGAASSNRIILLSESCSMTCFLVVRKWCV